MQSEQIVGSRGLSVEMFNEGIDEIVIEYGDRGFKIDKKKAQQWYEYFNKFEKEDFLNGIEECICTCNHVPYMADVYKAILSVKDKNKKWTDE